MFEKEAFVMPTLATLADNERLTQTVQHLVDHWNSDRLLSLRFIVVVLTVLMILLCGLRILYLHWNRHVQQKPIDTFVRVAKSLGLDWPQQWVLICIARHEGLPSPLTLLLSAATLRHHAQRYVDSIARYRLAKVSSHVSDVHRALFTK